MEHDRNGIVQRMALALEREARLQGFDIEPEITKILEKLKQQPKEKV